MTAEGTVMGTLPYMAPEQLRGETDIDGRVDVYALGVVLYECLVGHTPFAGGSIAELAVKIHGGEYPPVRATRPDVPSALEDAVACALSVERDQRFAQAQALRAALDAVVLPEWDGLDTLQTGRRQARLVWAVCSLLFALAVVVLTLQLRHGGSPVPAPLPTAAAVVPVPAAAVQDAPAAKLDHRPVPSVEPHSISTSDDKLDSEGPERAPRRRKLGASSAPSPSAPTQRSRANELGLIDQNPF